MAFNAKDHKRANVIPAAQYKLAMVKYERKQGAKNAANEYLNCTIKVVEGEFQGFTIFTMLNLKNDSDVAQEIGRADLAAFMVSCGIKSLESMWDISSMLNVEFDAKVKVKPDDGYGDKNDIGVYIPMSTYEEGGESGGNEVPDEPWADKSEADDKAARKAAKKAKKKAAKKAAKDVPF